MKVRNDFVSNSSSCSFVLTEPVAAFSLLKQDFNEVLDYVPYDFYELEVTIAAKRKDMSLIYNMFHNEEWKEPDDWYSRSSFAGESHKLKDPEEVLYEYGFELEQIFRMVQTWDEDVVKDVFNKVIELRVSTEDSNQGRVNYLRLLYLYFKNVGVDVSTEDSEIALEADKKKDFMCALMSRVLDGITNKEKEA